MNHLKSYKLFESHSELANTISDICLDLSDDGYEIDITTEEGRPHIYELKIEMYNKKFKPITIRDTLDRIYNVIGDNLINSSLRLYEDSSFGGSYYEIDSKSISKESSYVYGIGIRFESYGFSFESKNTIDMEDLKDMLLDLNDEGFETIVDGPLDYPTHPQYT
jgi:hypothetical protein